MPHVAVQIKKKLAIAVPDVAPAACASAETTAPQYASPASTVTSADQRNHHKARSIKPGMTLPLVAGSSSCIDRKPTRLKKYSRPIQVMPARKWIQRSSIRKGG